MKTLDDYVKELKTDDLIEAAHRAKERNHALLEEQGISTKNTLRITHYELREV